MLAQRSKAAFSNDPEVEKSLQHSLKDAAAFATMIGIGETYFSAFALFLKATTPQIGLLASLPPLLASFVQLLSAWLGRLTQQRKVIVLVGATVQAFTWLPLMILPVVFSEMAVPMWRASVDASMGQLDGGYRSNPAARPVFRTSNEDRVTRNLHVPGGWRIRVAGCQRKWPHAAGIHGAIWYRHARATRVRLPPCQDARSVGSCCSCQSADQRGVVVAAAAIQFCPLLSVLCVDAVFRSDRIAIFYGLHVA
jgi:hypothetical protein